jgi:hypothetical protein
MNASTRQSYSGEAFDRTTALALFIADRRRYEGRALPAHGYSAEDWAEAKAQLAPVK